MCVLYCDLNLVDLREALSDPPAASASPWGLLPAASLPGQLRGSKPAVPASPACIAGLQRDCRAWGSLPYVPCILAALRACNRLGIVRDYLGTTWDCSACLCIHTVCAAGARFARAAVLRNVLGIAGRRVQSSGLCLFCRVLSVLLCMPMQCYAVLSIAVLSILCMSCLQSLACMLYC